MISSYKLKMKFVETSKEKPYVHTIKRNFFDPVNVAGAEKKKMRRALFWGSGFSFFFFNLSPFSCLAQKIMGLERKIVGTLSSFLLCSDRFVQIKL